MRVLLAEDEMKVAGHIHAALRRAGFEVDEMHRGDAALELALARPYDLLVLDIMLPGQDGLSILKTLRANRNLVPVLILTARGEVSARVEGLNLGADDYLSKPFAMDELVARAQALTRRPNSNPAAVFEVHNLTVNLLKREVARAGSRIDLTPRELALLECLVRASGRALSRTFLVEQVWQFHFDTGTNLVDVYIQRLRRKLDDGHEVKLLHTVRGIGYMLRAPS